MRLTSRDVSLIRDLGLSHVVSRDQLLALGYFGSVTRANTRLRGLVQERFVTRLTTVFYGQSLYSAGPLAEEVVGERIGPLLASRSGSPRFIQHALTTNNVRIKLIEKGAKAWRFEQQVHREVGGHTLKPDGLALTTSTPLFVEVDLGHVAPQKFKEKLTTYQALSRGDLCKSLYGFEGFRLLTATTGPRRARHLRSLLPSPGFDYLVQTFDELGVPSVGGWS